MLLRLRPDEVRTARVASTGDRTPAGLGVAAGAALVVVAAFVAALLSAADGGGRVAVLAAAVLVVAAVATDPVVAEVDAWR